MFKCAQWIGVVGLSLLLLTAVTGCGPSGPDLAEVSGKVTQDGKPLPDANVTFQPAEGAPSYGTTDAQGVYALKYSDEAMGAVVGKHRVLVNVPNTDIEKAFEIEVTSGGGNIDLEMSKGVKPSELPSDGEDSGDSDAGGDN